MAVVPLLLVAYGPAQTAADEGLQRVLERSEIDPQYRWNLETTFRNVAEWEAEYQRLEQEIPRLAEMRGTLSQGPEQLMAVLTLRDQIEPRISRVFVYTSLLGDQDTRVGENQALRARARALAIKYSEATSWLEPELTAIPHDTIRTWMRQHKPLALYEQAFDDLYRSKEYILSEREEQLLAMAGEVFGTPGNAYRLLSGADLVGLYPQIEVAPGQTAELSDSAFYEFMRSPDRNVRRAAYEGIVGTYNKVRNAGAALLNGAVQSHLFSVKARGFDSCLQAALHNENIPVSVYNNLVDTVNENLPLLHRYMKLRRQALNLTDGVRAYDLFAPFTKEAKLRYTYEEAVETMFAALEPLGPEYCEPMKKGVASRWIDVYPTKGKRSGAYSSGTFLTQPYILLNFHGGYDDMSTLAHEMGHSMHSYFSRGTQPYVYSSYRIFCAEVASTTNEILLQDYVLERIDDPETKLFLLVELLETFRGTVFRQTMFSEFEQRIHEMAEQGVPLTADSLGAAYGEIMKKYYGPDYVHDELVDSYWLRIPHFYYNFYVYKYSTSFCAATNIARRILDGEPGAVEAYMQFLKGGSSQYPIDLLKLARVDMTSAQPIEDAMKHFERLLDETEKLLAQRG